MTPMREAFIALVQQGKVVPFFDETVKRVRCLAPEYAEVYAARTQTKPLPIDHAVRLLRMGK
jgi:hypothetical protein